MCRKVLPWLVSILVTVSVQAQRSNAIPDFGVVQYAGSIGYVSIGAGYDIFENKGRVSLHYGHTPSGKGGPLNIVAAKFFYEPLTVNLSNRLSFQPADIGIMISYHTGRNFSTRWPSHRYPEGYYWWKTSLRFHLALESSFTILFDDQSFFKKITGYAEFNTNELYIVSYVTNPHALSLSDIVKIGIGTRLSF
jgi:hypothetical protein